MLTFLNKEAQSQIPEVLFVVNNSGDTLVTSKIFENITNEDKVVFLLEGSKKTLLAKEVKSYYREGTKVSINLSPNNTSKLVSIILRGNITLAKSISSKRDEIFYIKFEENWLRLDHTSTNLKKQLSEFVPDFDKTISDKKIHYDLVSLGEVISRYNEHKNPSYKRVGKFKFQERIKIGVYGSFGLDKINIENPNATLDATTSVAFGMGANFQYSRKISFLILCGYSRNYWKNENWDIELKTLDLTPLISTQLYNKSNYFKLNAAVGFNANIELASNLTSTEFNSTKPIGLRGFSLGYDFRLYSSFGNSFDLFASYQIMPKRKTQKFDIINSEKYLMFNTSIIQFGIQYYFFQKAINN